MNRAEGQVWRLTSEGKCRQVQTSVYDKCMGLKTKCILRPNLGLSADVPGAPSPTSMGMNRVEGQGQSITSEGKCRQVDTNMALRKPPLLHKAYADQRSSLFRFEHCNLVKRKIYG